MSVAGLLPGSPQKPPITEEEVSVVAIVVHQLKQIGIQNLYSPTNQPTNKQMPNP
jgi:hypothetical protein